MNLGIYKSFRQKVTAAALIFDGWKYPPSKLFKSGPISGWVCDGQDFVDLAVDQPPSSGGSWGTAICTWIWNWILTSISWFSQGIWNFSIILKYQAFFWNLDLSPEGRRLRPPSCRWPRPCFGFCQSTSGWIPLANRGGVASVDQCMKFFNQVFELGPYSQTDRKLFNVMQENSKQFS